MERQYYPDHHGARMALTNLLAHIANVGATQRAGKRPTVTAAVLQAAINHADALSQHLADMKAAVLAGEPLDSYEFTDCGGVAYDAVQHTPDHIDR